ncbi:MAG: hypothetical protein JWR13_6 [Mycobacterium sp.]|jgi:hypothetical protein|nr:hypothetical protein [Mycobacterium sp.]
MCGVPDDDLTGLRSEYADDRQRVRRVAVAERAGVPWLTGQLAAEESQLDDRLR